MNRNDLDEELEEKVVDEGRRRGHRHCVDLFNLLTEVDPQDVDVVVYGKELDVFFGGLKETSTSTSIHHRDKMITEMMDEKKGHAEDEAKHIKQHRCDFE